MLKGDNDNEIKYIREFSLYNIEQVIITTRTMTFITLDRQNNRPRVAPHYLAYVNAEPRVKMVDFTTDFQVRHLSCTVFSIMDII